MELTSRYLRPVLVCASLVAPWTVAEEGSAIWGGRFTLSGEARIRAETVDPQFRAGAGGSDQAVLTRLLLLAETRIGRVTLGVEAQDIRSYADDSATPLSASFVNPADILQAYARVDMTGVFGAQTASLLIGRQTVDIGSRRIIERPNFRNTMDPYTGARFQARWSSDWEFDALATLLVRIEPQDRDARGGNEAVFDRETPNRRIGGVLLAKNEAMFGGRLEAYVFGLHEGDRRNTPTSNRRLAIPGVRYHRKPSIGRWDGELEVAARLGTQRLTRDPGDMRDLSVRAHMIHAELGRTWDAAFTPRLALELDLASGDDDPNDDRIGTYERLFGTRRRDLGNTSIFGPLTRQNLRAFGVRWSVKRGRYDARGFYKAAFLASPTDSYRVARLTDPTGESGLFLGHALDFRARTWVVEDFLRFEVGASAQVGGRFSDAAPNAPAQDDSYYLYTQMKATF